MEAIEGRSREGQRRAAMAGAQVAGGGPKAASGSVDFGLGDYGYLHQTEPVGSNIHVDMLDRVLQFKVY